MNTFKILFFTQEDPFYVKIFFEEFFKNYANLNEIKGIVISKTMGESPYKLAKRLIQFYGPKDIFKMTVRLFIQKSKSIISDLFGFKGAYSVKQLCKKFEIKCIPCDDINGDEFLTSLRHINLDLIISVACPKIFKKELLLIPKKGCINIHHAPLPRYRGMMPNFWQLYHGEKNAGITVHKINCGIDDGDILLQEIVPIRAEESLESLIKRTKRIGAKHVIEAINSIKEDNYEKIENKKEEGSYFSFPTREDVQKFREKGLRIL